MFFFNLLFTEALIAYYQANESLWNHNVAEYHTNSNKDLLLNFLQKELDDKFTPEEITKKWKNLVTMFKQEHSKAMKKPSGSGTNEIYKPTWELYSSLQFIDVICDDTDDTLDSITGPSAAKSRKMSKQKKIDDRENKKLELFAEAIEAMKVPSPIVSKPLVESKESVAFGNYVALTLAKLTPQQFRRAKKQISDVLYEMEEKDEIERGNYSYSHNTGTQRAFRDLSGLNSNSGITSSFSYGDNSYSGSCSSNMSFNSYAQGSQGSSLSAVQQLRSNSPLDFVQQFT